MERGHVRQLIVGFSATITFFIGGTLLGWTAPVQIKLQEKDAKMQVSDKQVGWFVNWVSIGMLCIPVPAGYIADKFGRKTTLMVTALPSLVSWIMVIFAESLTILYVARFLAGLGLGTAFTVAPMYMGEIAQDRIRGGLGTLFQVMMTSGIIFEYSVGPYVSYKTLATLSSMFPVIFFVTIVWMPESPYYLIMRNRREDAEKSLLKLRCKELPENVHEELDMIQYSVETHAKSKGSIKDLFRNKGNRKALIIVNALLLNQHVSGIIPMLSFMTKIFQTSGSSIDKNISAIIVGIVQLVGSVVASMLVDYAGRKPLLLISNVGCTLSLAVQGFYFYFATESNHVDWIPITFMIVYVLSWVLGVGPVPWAICAEVFPTDVKSIATAIASMFTAAMGFVAILVFNGIAQREGEYLAFLLFSACCGISIILICIFVPETKGKSLLEINKMLNRGSHDEAENHVVQNTNAPEENVAEVT